MQLSWFSLVFDLLVIDILPVHDDVDGYLLQMMHVIPG